MVKYIFVTGGVVSGLGKGITAASLGRLLKSRGHSITMQKFDPYINVDPGTMNPIQHGEVFVTEDGAETDLDLGHYERFIDEYLDKNSNVTTGKIFWEVLHRERAGDYNGHTVQTIPHITNAIKDKFYTSKDNEDKISIIEIGGTVGDIESQPFLEAIRQFQTEVGFNNAIIIHVTLIPYLKASEEIKTKPTQMSVKVLQSIGLRPNILVCRSDYELTDDIRKKIALFCNVDKQHVLQNLNAKNLYEVPLMLEKEHIADLVCQDLQISNSTPKLSTWKDMCRVLESPKHACKIALVGKYVSLHDSYLSVVEALTHGGIDNNLKVEILWIDSEKINSNNLKSKLKDVDGVIVPGGFGTRGTLGIIEVIKYCRESDIPFFGICFGLQLSIIEFARNVLKFNDANSIEIDPKTTYPVIHLMENQKYIKYIGGTMRLGSYPCVVKQNSLAYKLYKTNKVSERHRHRYEVNNAYCAYLEDAGMSICGRSPNKEIVEMIELKNHPFFLATQAHPEFKSRPNKPHPLFSGFIAASLKHREKSNL